jgi:hypothetical protein
MIDQINDKNELGNILVEFFGSKLKQDIIMLVANSLLIINILILVTVVFWFCINSTNKKIPRM